MKYMFVPMCSQYTPHALYLHASIILDCIVFVLQQFAAYAGYSSPSLCWFMWKWEGKRDKKWNGSETNKTTGQWWCTQCRTRARRLVGTSSSSTPLSLLSSAAASTPTTTLSPHQIQYIQQWQRQSDFHNNYGCDFIPPILLGDSYQHCISHLSKGDIMSHQSGPGTDDNTHANRLWNQCVASCSRLFHNLHLLCLTSHATDLLSHIPAVIVGLRRHCRVIMMGRVCSQQQDNA